MKKKEINIAPYGVIDYGKGKFGIYGLDDHGQLGRGWFDGKIYPVEHPVMLDGKWKKVVRSNSHSAGIRSDGKVCLWGCNEVGQLGFPINPYNNTYPKPIVRDVPSKCKDICVNEVITLILLENGKLYVAGGNEYGLYGNGLNDTEQVISRFQTVPGKWKDIELTDTFAVGLCDNKIKAWGDVSVLVKYDSPIFNTPRIMEGYHDMETVRKAIREHNEYLLHVSHLQRDTGTVRWM